MRPKRATSVLLCSGVLGLVLSPIDGAQGQAHYEARKQPTEYNGPGRDDPAPVGIDQVKIGYFGPADPGQPEGGDLFVAANLAIEEANAEGGYQGIPFRLVAAWAENPWGTGVAGVARMVYSDHVWAIVGSIDGASTHLAEQVVAKARVALISPASTDKTVNLAHVPWMFSCLPGDHVLAPLLVRALVDQVQDGAFILISSTDHDSRVFAAEVLSSLAREGVGPEFHLHVDPGDTDLSPLVDTVASARPRAVVIVAGALPSARLVHRLREASFTGAVFGGPSMGRRAFVEAAGGGGEGVVFPFLLARSPSDFDKRFREHYGRSADYASTHAYDATRLAIEAIRKTGLNRARIRDTLVELSPWEGAGGRLAWDRLGQNERPARLGTVRRGQVVPWTPP